MGETAETAAEAVDGERKTVTALFADIKGSMELIEDLDPEERAPPGRSDCILTKAGKLAGRQT